MNPNPSLSTLSPELQSKLRQIEEQVQLAMQDYPERLALDRLKFALALVKFVRTQIDLDATVEQSAPGGIKVSRPTQQ